MLRVRNLSKALHGFALRDISFEVADGEYFVVLGASGAGKTLLLELVAGFAHPDQGAILWNDVDITRARAQRRGMGLVCQDRSLFPHMTVFQNVAYGLRGKGLTRRRVSEKVHELLSDVEAEHLAARFPVTLSGGEAQRVALARAAAVEPRCLLLDEPMSSLDVQARRALRALLRKLHRRGLTIVHVTHEYEEAVSLASRVGIMEHGTVVQVGTPTEVFHHPKSEFVARFIGIRNFLRGRLEGSPDGQDGLARFVTEGLPMDVLTDSRPGPGYLILRSEDITVALEPAESSARNTFQGTVSDVVPAPLGVEVIVDVGVELAALVTAQSAERFDLHSGKRVWVSFKASAARFVEEQND